MAIQLLSLPTLVGGVTPGYPGYVNTLKNKINELATAMSISNLTLNAQLGAGSPANDFNTMVAKVNEFIKAYNASTQVGVTTPLEPIRSNWWYNSGIYYTSTDFDYPASEAALKYWNSATAATSIVVRGRTPAPNNSFTFSVLRGSIEKGKYVEIFSYRFNSTSTEDVVVNLPANPSGLPYFIVVGPLERPSDSENIRGLDVMSITCNPGDTHYFEKPTQAARVIAEDGDSTSVGAGSNPEQLQCAGALLRKETQDYNLLGYASARASFQFSAANWPAKKAALHAAFDAAQEGIYFITVGTNDVPNSTPAAFKTLLRNHLQRVISEFPTLKIGIGTLLAVDPTRTTGIPDQATYESFRQVQRDVATEFGIELLERAGLASHPDDFNDFVHPNAQGYAKLAPAYQAFFGRVAVPTAPVVPAPTLQLWSDTKRTDNLTVSNAGNTVQKTAGAADDYDNYIGGTKAISAVGGTYDLGSLPGGVSGLNQARYIGLTPVSYVGRYAASHPGSGYGLADLLYGVYIDAGLYQKFLNGANAGSVKSFQGAANLHSIRLRVTSNTRIDFLLDEVVVTEMGFDVPAGVFANGPLVPYVSFYSAGAGPASGTSFINATLVDSGF